MARGKLQLIKAVVVPFPNLHTYSLNVTCCKTSNHYSCGEEAKSPYIFFWIPLEYCDRFILDQL